MSGRLATLTQIEIWVCESADGQLSRITPLCAYTVVRMRMSTVRLGWQTGVKVLPRDMQATNQMSFCLFSSEASRLVTVIPYLLSITVDVTVRTWESGETCSQCPGAHFNAVSSVRVGSQLPSEESLQWRQRWAGPWLWWGLLWLLPGDFSQPGLSLTAWSQKAE